MTSAGETVAFLPHIHWAPCCVVLELGVALATLWGRPVVEGAEVGGVHESLCRLYPAWMSMSRVSWRTCCMRCWLSINRDTTVLFCNTMSTLTQSSYPRVTSSRVAFAVYGSAFRVLWQTKNQDQVTAAHTKADIHSMFSLWELVALLLDPCSKEPEGERLKFSLSLSKNDEKNFKFSFNNINTGGKHILF